MTGLFSLKNDGVILFKKCLKWEKVFLFFCDNVSQVHFLLSNGLLLSKEMSVSSTGSSISVFCGSGSTSSFVSAAVLTQIVKLSSSSTSLLTSCASSASYSAVVGIGNELEVENHLQYHYNQQQRWVRVTQVDPPVSSRYSILKARSLKEKNTYANFILGYVMTAEWLASRTVMMLHEY